jgi:hypothetical protein
VSHLPMSEKRNKMKPMKIHKIYETKQNSEKQNWLHYSENREDETKESQKWYFFPYINQA